MSDFSTAFTNPQMQSAASSYLQNASLANASSSLSGAGALGTKPSTPNPRANKPKILKYPQAKLEQADDYMMIKVIRYTRRGIETGKNNFKVTTATETIRNPNFRTILQTIILPMPKNLPADTNQVNWGDGTTTLHNSNTIAQRDYNYSTYDTGNTTLSSRGYKQAIITVTPVSGNLLTCNFQQRFVTSPVQNQAYSSGFLDCILSMPNSLGGLGSNFIFGGTTVRHRYVERFELKTVGNCVTLFELFRGCSSLQLVPLFDTSNCTRLDGMFRECSSIRQIPFLNSTNNTNFASMFQDCTSLQSVPLFIMTNVTNTLNMFGSCVSLQSIPPLDTSNITSMTNMFFNCASLKSIPPLSTVSITTTTGDDFGTLFAVSCVSLTRCQMVFARTVSFASCQLSQTALVEIFNNLVDRTSTTSATITITGNWGASALTAGERLIATNKNWVIVG
jgi:hypothetical protein